MEKRSSTSRWKTWKKKIHEKEDVRFLKMYFCFGARRLLRFLFATYQNEVAKTKKEKKKRKKEGKCDSKCFFLPLSVSAEAPISFVCAPSILQRKIKQFRGG